MLYVNKDVVLIFEDGTKIKRAWLEEENGQAILSRRKNQSLLCKCTPAGVPMHVVTRGETHHISTNPNYAHCHALSCPSYVEDPSSTRLSLYSEAAIRRKNHRQHVAVNYVASQRPPMSHLSPGALLDYLWELSGLTVCTPKTVTTRTNFMVSQALFDTSKCISVNGQPLEVHVPMTKERRPYADEEWVIGQVAKARRGKFDNRITLTGERTPLWVTQTVWEGAHLSEHLGEYAKPTLNKHLWLIAKVSRSTESNFHIHTVGIREMNAYFLPCYEFDPKLNELIAAKEKFKICPRYDSLSTDYPDALLFKEDAPQPLFFD